MKKELIQKVKEVLDRHNPTDKFKGGIKEDGSFLFTKNKGEVTLIIGGEFYLGSPDYRLHNFYQSITLNEIEEFLFPILSDYKLAPKNHVPHTMTLTEETGSNRESFMQLCNLKCDISDPKDFELRFEKYYQNSIALFFETYSSTIKCYDYIKAVPFEEIINSALRGEYPSNLYKALYLERKHGDSNRFNMIYGNLQKWNEEDKEDPNYGHLYDSYVGSLSAIKEKLSW